MGNSPIRPSFAAPCQGGYQVTVRLLLTGVAPLSSVGSRTRLRSIKYPQRRDSSLAKRNVAITASTTAAAIDGTLPHCSRVPLTIR